MQKEEPTLREVQQRFQALVLHFPDRARGADFPADALRLVAAPKHDTVATRLDVYARGYPARIHEALVEAYPAVAHVLGEQHFGALAQRYAERVPFRWYSLNEVGSALADFLGDDTLSEHLPFLPDLAALEWRVACAFHAREQTPFDPAPLVNWTLSDWERCRLGFQSSVAVVSSKWPIREIWEARTLPVGEIDIPLAGRPDCVLVRRAGLRVLCESIPAHEGNALRALLAGCPLGVVGALPDAQAEDPAWVSEAFARWMQAGLLTACVREPAPG